jgi:hypothetical protein
MINENYFIIMTKMILAGFKFDRELSGNLEVWKNFQTGKEFVIERESKNITMSMLESILKQADITLEEFKLL